MVYAKHSHNPVGLLSFISVIFAVYLLRTANAIKNLISDVSSLLKFLIDGKMSTDYAHCGPQTNFDSLVMVLFVSIGA